MFEFAKEIGFETLALMEKLRKWNIPVKNHMTELDEQTLKAIRNHLLLEAEEGEKSLKKRRVVRKKTPQKSTGQASQTAKRPSHKVIRRKASDLPSVKQAKARTQKEKEKEKRDIDKDNLFKKTHSTHKDKKTNESVTSSNKSSDTIITGKAIVGEMDLHPFSRTEPNPLTHLI